MKIAFGVGITEAMALSVLEFSRESPQYHILSLTFTPSEIFQTVGRKMACLPKENGTGLMQRMMAQAFHCDSPWRPVIVREAYGPWTPPPANPQVRK
jgi:hypothetical protein